jgi:indolepyruvate ferredoxin oxidoreductase
MGGEGVDWASHSMFTKTPHVFQNLGDGTYFHSGVLAIRQAVAAGTNITYKILYNDAVAMTGGQPVDGSISVPQVARQVEAEGVTQLVVVSDEPEKFDGQHQLFPPGTTFHHRRELDDVQRRLREQKGVTVLIYDQTCAAEKRRRRKKGEFPDPDKRLFINQEVCEGCGDCGVQSNCLSVEPVETIVGRKRRIDQSSCNKDYSCVNGFCPSFVTVEGGKLKKTAGAGFDRAALAERIAALPHPALRLDDAPYDILITGVGGTGVVTVGALISMAAHLEGKSASVLDFMGFAQKGGAVLSFVRFAERATLLHQVRIDTQQADLLLACDMVVGASADALQTVRHGRTRIVVNSHAIPNATFVQHPDASLHADALLEKMRHAAGAGRLASCDAHALAAQFLGDTIGANIVMLGHAWQLGLVPVSLDALTRAIELNNVAVSANCLALSIGRLAAADPAALAALLREPATANRIALEGATPDTVDGELLVTEHTARLAAYGGARYVARYRRLLADADSAIAHARERGLDAAGTAALKRALAHTFYRLLAVKDEYEVARLYTDGTFKKAIEAQFDGVAGRDFRVKFNMAPPLVARGKNGAAPRKIELGQWLWPVLGVLARCRWLRGTVADPFGKSVERRMERQLAHDYENTLRRALVKLDATTLADTIALASEHAKVRGYGHVKLANLAAAKRRERDLAQRLEIEPVTGPAVAAALAQTRGAGQLRGIPVVIAK